MAKKKLTEEEFIETASGDILGMQDTIRKKLKKMIEECPDAKKLTDIWINLQEINKEMQGTRATMRNRVMRQTTEEIKKSADNEALLEAALATTDTDFSMILAKQLDRKQKMKESEGQDGR